MVIAPLERYEQNVNVLQTDLGSKHAISNIFFFSQLTVESRAVKGLPSRGLYEGH